MQTHPCNLDALADDELARFVSDALHSTIPPEIPDALHATFRIELRNYALTLQQARASRAAGNTVHALWFEGRLESVYNRLPLALRW